MERLARSYQALEKTEKIEEKGKAMFLKIQLFEAQIGKWVAECVSVSDQRKFLSVSVSRKHWKARKQKQLIVNFKQKKKDLVLLFIDEMSHRIQDNGNFERVRINTFKILLPIAESR